MANFLDWNYNHVTGAVIELPSPQSAVMRAMGLGWHGPFNTKEEAVAFYTANKDAHPEWKAPTGVAGTIQNAITTGGDIATGKAFTDQLGQLNLGGWFLRIGEILLGIVLIGVGIAKLTGAANAVSKLVKVAAIA